MQWWRKISRPICIHDTALARSRGIGAYPGCLDERLTMKVSRFVGGLAAAALVLPLAAAVAAPAASAADMGTVSLASVLTSGKQGFDQNHKDYDILTAAVLAVLKAKPNSPVKVLTDGKTPLTAFIPDDQAFMNLASALTKKKVTSEAAAFKVVAGLGIPTVERVLEYHVVPGATILSGDALKANGAHLKTALAGKTIGVKVVAKPASITLVDYNTKLPNPKVILNQVDINKGNVQVAHGIDAVLMPTN